MNEAAIAETRRYGFMISALAVLVGAAYAVGILRRSYWALALPVTAGTAGALYIALWIGRALIATANDARREPTSPTD
jgi:hypothetical protein